MCAAMLFSGERSFIVAHILLQNNISESSSATVFESFNDSINMTSTGSTFCELFLLLEVCFHVNNWSCISERLIFIAFILVINTIVADTAYVFKRSCTFI